MKYKNIVSGTFLKRVNRFIAEAEIDGERIIAHVKNTGRCKELFIKGATAYFEDFRNPPSVKPLRKTEFSLIAIVKESTRELINIDSQAPNKVVEEALVSGKVCLSEMTYPIKVFREKKFLNSRFDFYIEDANGKKGYMEVKGVTLEGSGLAVFPDAPTARGARHLRELTEAKKEGYLAYAFFVIQMKGVNSFMPNTPQDPDFAKALKEAYANGVRIMIYDCNVAPDSLEIDMEIPLKSF